MNLFRFVAAAGALSLAIVCTAAEPVMFKFDFGGDGGAVGFLPVTPDTVFSVERGFGLEAGAAVRIATNAGQSGVESTALASEAPFLFSVVVPEGNYRVKLTLGASAFASDNTIKSESRRLMLEKLTTQPGEFVTRTIAVNVRNSSVPPPERNAPGGDRVVLNDREQGVRHWDDKLTLEFNGARPAIAAVEIVRDEAMPTVFLVGDSTVTDQTREPGASWGQMLPRFLTADVAVANHAESGETMKSFISGLRLAKVLSQMQAGDYLFMQFGHNDQKQQWPQTYVEAGTTYQAYLRAFIAEARLRGATPVLVTSMQRRQFDAHGRIRNSHGDYPQAVRDVAREENVALIDLDLASRAFYEALGPEKAPLAFAGDGRDPTHHNNYGAYELAQVVVQGIREAKLELAQHIVDDFKGFDPTQPDDVETWSIPASPGARAAQPPRGN